MRFAHPVTAKEIQQRNKLLQLTLRPDSLSFPIEDEYPIVLAESNTPFSYGYFNNEELLAHANLWPRQLVDPSGQAVLKIGLIGNVATNPKWQGKGLMTQVFQQLEKIARKQQLEALILWSDLEQFYQRLGFRSLGKEFLCRIIKQAKPQLESTDISLSFPSQVSNDTKLFRQLLMLRPEVACTLERSEEEFYKMLEIPCCDICILQRKGHIIAYCIIGKGYDMMGVVHEWGALTQADLELCLQHIISCLGVQEILLLAPFYLSQPWLDFLKAKDGKAQELGMAYCKLLSENLEHIALLDKSFIWGLDSI